MRICLMEYFIQDLNTDLNRVTKALKDILNIKLSRVRERHASAMGFNSYNHLVADINQNETARVSLDTYFSKLDEEMRQHHHFTLTPTMKDKISALACPVDTPKHNFILLRFDILSTPLSQFSHYIHKGISETNNTFLFNAIQANLPEDIKLKGGVLVDMPLSGESTGFQGHDVLFQTATTTQTLTNIATYPHIECFEGDQNSWRLDINSSTLLCLCKIEPRKVPLKETYTATPELLAHLQLSIRPNYEQELSNYTAGDSEFVFAASIQAQTLVDLVLHEEFSEEGEIIIPEITFFDEISNMDVLHFIYHIYRAEWDGYCAMSDEDTLTAVFDSLGKFISIDSLNLVNKEEGEVWPVGRVYFRENHPPTFVFMHFDDLGGLASDLSSSSNHGVGKIIKTVCPTAIYQVYADRYDHMYQHYDDVAKPHPLVCGAFAEQIKEWPEKELPIPSETEFVFEQYKNKLINELGVDKVLVDDFQEPFEDMSSVIIVGFYSGVKLVAEVAYSVIVQNDNVNRKNPCIEITFDNKIKDFAKPNNITVNYSELCGRHTYGKRKLSHFQSDYCLFPTVVDEYMINNLLLMNVVISHENTTPTLLNTKELNKLIAEIFIPCRMSKDEKYKPHPLEFISASYAKARLLTIDEVKTKLAFKHERNHIDKKEYTNASDVIFGGFNMEGMPEHEIKTSIRNMAIIYEKDERKGFMELGELAIKQWKEKLSANITGVKFSFGKLNSMPDEF